MRNCLVDPLRNINNRFLLGLVGVDIVEFAFNITCSGGWAGFLFFFGERSEFRFGAAGAGGVNTEGTLEDESGLRLRGRGLIFFVLFKGLVTVTRVNF